MTRYFALYTLMSLLLMPSIKAQKTENFNHGWYYTNVVFSKENISRPDIGSDWEDQFTNTNKGAIELEHDDTKEETHSYAQEEIKLKSVKWFTTSLPHNALDKGLVIDEPKEGFTYYKKSFKIPKRDKGKRLTIEFEAAMQLALVWVNGKFMKQHLGGYLPFTIDITDVVNYGENNEILIKLDNRPYSSFPPGKPTPDLDFLYYSGLYRDVWLHKKYPLHITDANFIDRQAGGGVFITYPIVTDSLAMIDIKTNIINQSKSKEKFDIIQELIDDNNQISVVAKKTLQELDTGEDEHYFQKIEVESPRLWSPDNPNLYTLKTKVLKKGKVVDSKETKIGIRSIYISKKTGLMINDRPIKLEGSNRHQSYPWIGNALSNNANKRDAILIKNAGMNSIRLAHYPQDPSFYQAADSLGLLIINPVPGWQYYNESQEFQENAFKDIRQMIRRDRNHPSVVLWELSLNEAYPPVEFRCKQVEVGKSEWKVKDTNFYTSGDSNYKKACYDVPYGDWGGDAGDRNNTVYPDNAFLIREYGDFEYGGFKSTTRQLRGDGEKALQQQAWNLQWGHNRNRQKYPRGIGDLTWAFFDGMPGYLEGIEGWGIVDLKRIPKFSYYFFQSQNRKRPPMVYIADYWNKQDSLSTKDIIVYSNAYEVALFVNNKKIDRRLPDIGKDTPYGEDFISGGNPFDGGNANALNSPPFTFKGISYEPGELKAIAYNDEGEKVASTKVVTAGEAAKIVLEPDTQGIPLKADDADVIFIRAKILDDFGNIVYNNYNEVQFKVSGFGRAISPLEVNAEAGIATLMLQATQNPGEIEISADGIGLISDTIIVESQSN